MVLRVVVGRVALASRVAFGRVGFRRVVSRQVVVGRVALPRLAVRGRWRLRLRHGRLAAADIRGMSGTSTTDPGGVTIPHRSAWYSSWMVTKIARLIPRSIGAARGEASPARLWRCLGCVTIALAAAHSAPVRAQQANADATDAPPPSVFYPNVIPGVATPLPAPTAQVPDVNVTVIEGATEYVTVGGVFGLRDRYGVFHPLRGTVAQKPVPPVTFGQIARPDARVQRPMPFYPRVVIRLPNAPRRVIVAAPSIGHEHGPSR
jgi:hypothetical protein